MKDEVKVKVKLLKPHTHAGKEHKVGETVSVPQRLLGWLADHGVIEKPAATAAAPATDKGSK